MSRVRARTAFGNAWFTKHSSDHAAELPHYSTFSARSGTLTEKLESASAPCANDAIRYDDLYQKVDFAGNVRDAGQLVELCDPIWAFSRQVATHYYYRADNRLKVVQRYDQFSGSDKNGTWEEYRYDALGRRVLVHALRDSLCHLSNGGDCTSFDLRTVWDGDRILAEDRHSSSGSPETTGTVAYVHGTGLDQPLAILDSRYGMDGRVPHLNWRGLGESSSWTDGTPADCTLMSGPCTTINWPAGQGVYFEKPYSQSWPPAATWVGSLIANGEDGTSLLYRRNRFYDPASGQFTQQDPIGLGGGMNVYGFAAGDPVNFGDPFGLSCEGLWKDELAALQHKQCPAFLRDPGIEAGWRSVWARSEESRRRGKPLEFAAIVLPAPVAGPNAVYSEDVTKYTSQSAREWQAMVPVAALRVIHSHVIRPGEPIPGTNEVALEGFSPEDTSQTLGGRPVSAIMVDDKHLHYYIPGQGVGQCDKPVP
jgi:RHS repeat-associated protein